MNIINVVVTCTKQKTVEAPASLQLRNVVGATLDSRLQRWSSRIGRVPNETVTPRTLYAGDHWAVARSLPELAKQGEAIQVWVISAGYGLLNLDARIAAYSATFSTRHPDTVVTRDAKSFIDPATDKRRWWNGLIGFNWDRERPVSITDLASEFPDCPMIMAASSNYLHATQDDLIAARSKLSDPQQLSIFSAGTDSLGELSPHLIPANGNLQSVVGGVLRSLNIRLLRHAFEMPRRGDLTLTNLTRRFQRLVDETPERPKFDREPMTDDEVRRFVRNAVKSNECVTQTRLLRELRDSGKACEQGRFRTLFNEVRGAIHG